MLKGASKLWVYLGCPNTNRAIQMSRKKQSPNDTPSVEQPPSRFKGTIRLLLFAVLGFGVAFGFTLVANRTPSEPDMVWIPGGEFVMGTQEDTPHKNEQPAHRVRVNSFFMDKTEVTNAQFRKFVDATGYVTTAEKPPDWEEIRKQLPPDTPKPTADKLVPGSLVFRPTEGPAPFAEFDRWWNWTPGACWKTPEGPESSLADRDDHPVVHISWEDATAYAKWAGKRLPTEAEWEFAARGGLVNKRYGWGDQALSDTDGKQANIWQGNFPYRNTKTDGWERTAPVMSFPPNGYGLFDMSGNVWEWCSDWYRADAYVNRTGITENPRGPDTFWDPREPLVPKRVMRGGSFLCHVTYCESYRPAARRGTSTDTSMSHIGFRCVKDAK
jgi:formylglycine-generating enzyme